MGTKSTTLPGIGQEPDRVSAVLQDGQGPAWDAVPLLLCRQLQDIGQTPGAGFPKCLAIWRSLPITIRSCVFLPRLVPWTEVLVLVVAHAQAEFSPDAVLLQEPS